jgi:hypothetical protein
MAPLAFWAGPEHPGVLAFPPIALIGSEGVAAQFSYAAISAGPGCQQNCVSDRAGVWVGADYRSWS